MVRPPDPSLPRENEASSLDKRFEDAGCGAHGAIPGAGLEDVFQPHCQQGSAKIGLMELRSWLTIGSVVEVKLNDWARAEDVV